MATLPGRWTPALLLAVAGLLGASLTATVLRLLELDPVGLDSLERWFNVNRELGLPAWFSTVLLVFCAQALWLLGDQRAAAAGRRWLWHERLLAVVFVYLSVDELLALHEMLNAPLRDRFDLDGVLTFAWVVVALPLVGLLGLFMIGYLRSLPTPVRRLFLLSGVVYVVGAAGVELVGAAIWSRGGADSAAYAAATMLEEGLEMLALVLFLGVVTSYRRSLAPADRIG